eukprot:scaffold228643_cov24-Tisochrysis_lutea.AAC.1
MAQQPELEPAMRPAPVEEGPLEVPAGSHGASLPLTHDDGPLTPPRQWESATDVVHTERFEPTDWDDAACNVTLTPRTVEACLSQGIEPHELRKKELSEFRGSSQERVPKRIAEMRYEHFERRRINKIQAVLAAREAMLRAWQGEGSLRPATTTSSSGGADWLAIKRKEAERRKESEARRAIVMQQAAEQQAKATTAVMKQNEELNARLTQLEVQRARELEFKRQEEAARQRERQAKVESN